MSDITKLPFGYYDVGGLVMTVGRDKLGRKQIVITVPPEIESAATDAAEKE